MTANADKPLAGKNETVDDAKKSNDFEFQGDYLDYMKDDLQARSSDMSFGFRLEPASEDIADSIEDDDNLKTDKFGGPVIKRVDGGPQQARKPLCTPHLFSQQFDDEEFTPPENNELRIPAMHENLLDPEPRQTYHASQHPRMTPQAFSVAAVRAERMKKFSGNGGGAGFFAKTAMAAGIGAFCVVSGVMLGIHGPELGSKAGDQARIAGAAIAGVIPWGDDSQSEDKSAAKSGEAKQAASNSTVTRKKLIYARIPQSTASNSTKQWGKLKTGANLQPQPVAAVKPPARLSGLDALIAAPTDF